MPISRDLQSVGTQNILLRGWQYMEPSRKGRYQGQSDSSVVRALRALPEGPDLVLSTHMVTHDCLSLQFGEFRCPSLASAATRHMVHIHRSRQNTHKRGIKIKYTQKKWQIRLPDFDHEDQVSLAFPNGQWRERTGRTGSMVLAPITLLPSYNTDDSPQFRLHCVLHWVLEDSQQDTMKDASLCAHSCFLVTMVLCCARPQQKRSGAYWPIHSHSCPILRPCSVRGI